MRNDLWSKLISYARNPITPSSAGVLAILNGVFSPFAYVPLSSFSGRFLNESIESYSLFNRGSGFILIILVIVSFLLLLKKKHLFSAILVGLSLLIVFCEAYSVTVNGVRGHQFSSIYDQTMAPIGREPIVVYDLVVRARLGNAVGYLLGGHIAFFFALSMDRNMSRRSPISSSPTKPVRKTILVAAIAFLAGVVLLAYYLIVFSGKPIAETHIEGIINQ